MAEPEHPTTTPAPPALKLDRAPGHLIRCAQQAHSALWHSRFDGELTSPQYGVLSILADNPDIDQRTAGSLVALDKSTIADVVRRLERRGWLTRQRDRIDSRRNLLRLTAEAETALETLTPLVVDVQEQLLAHTAGVHRDRFLELLSLVAYQGVPEVPRRDRGTGASTVEVATAPGHLLRRAEQVHNSLWFEELGSGVTSPQYAIISTLVHAHAPLDQRTAGEHASVDKSSLADVVRRLENRGWLTRVRDLDDGRRRLLRLTPVALYAVPPVTEGVQRVQQRVMAPLPHDAREELMDGLAAIAAQAH